MLSLLCILVGIAQASGGLSNVTAKVPALFVFGDSIVDPGNNNYIPTLAKANFPPYGRDFIDHKPTGRFSNGKLSTDFIAAGLGLKETLPPYLDPDLSTQELMTGVSFASAGTGYDNLTAEVASVIPMWKQAKFFRDYSVLLGERVGEEKASTIIREAIVLSCAGTNDLIENYFFSAHQEKSVHRYAISGLPVANLLQLHSGSLQCRCPKIWYLWHGTSGMPTCAENDQWAPWNGRLYQ